MTVEHLNIFPALLDVRAAITGADTNLDGTNLQRAARIRFEEESALEKIKKNVMNLGVEV